MVLSWELRGLNRLHQLYSAFDLAPETRSLLIPTFVNGNHWIICVARFGANDHEIVIDWYNSSSGILINGNGTGSSYVSWSWTDMRNIK